jgi:hypothetical protein
VVGNHEGLERKQGGFADAGNELVVCGISPFGTCNLRMSLPKDNPSEEAEQDFVENFLGFSDN